LDTSQPVGRLWANDRPDAETSTCQHTTLTRDKHRTSNPSKRAAADPRLRPRGHQLFYRKHKTVSRDVTSNVSCNYLCL